MNIFDSLFELDDHHEDFLGLIEPSFEVEPDFWLELDIESMAL
jgi:hypothetical protein